MTAENPLYVPSAEGETLAALAEAKRKEMNERNAAPDPLIREDLSAAGEKTMSIVEELARRFNLEVPTKIELELAEREASNRGPSPEGLALAKDRRIARFNRMCPPAFREPWDWRKVKPEVSREEAAKVFNWQFGPRGLYIAGESGHSKTRALMVLLRRLVVREGRDVMFLDGIAFSALCTKAFGKPDETEAILAPLVDAKVLVVDDLAKRWTPATEEGAFAILDRRTARERPFICTLNYTTDDLFAMQQARGELAAIRDVATPFIRRLVDYCELAVL